VENNFEALGVEELSIEEVEQVNGGSLMSSIGYWVGYACGGGGAMMKSIDNSGNMMLSAMQYGA
jgi:hypothetical protein